MGFCSRYAFKLRLSGLFAGLILACTGCQSTPSVSTRRLIEHQAMIDFSGLDSPQVIPELKVSASIPNGWEGMAVQSRPMYTHEQWQAASEHTGLGIAYLHLPIPVSPKVIIWFAKQEYSNHLTKDGKPQGTLLGEWTDSLGREWFEAENAKYHVKGYAVTAGFDSWIVYSGYRIHDPINPAEIGMAIRSMDTVLPTPLANPPSHQADTASRINPPSARPAASARGILEQ